MQRTMSNAPKVADFDLSSACWQSREFPTSLAAVTIVMELTKKENTSNFSEVD